MAVKLTLIYANPVDPEELERRCSSSPRRPYLVRKPADAKRLASVLTQPSRRLQSPEVTPW